ncbi:MAG: chloride channel protein [Halanaerobacter sp.]
MGFLGANLVLALRLVINTLRSLVPHNLFLTPILGGVLVGVIIYYFDFRASGLGTNRYIGYTKQERLIRKPGKLLVSKFSNTVLTLGLMGVEGLVGPSLLLGSSLASLLQQLADKFKIGFVTTDEEYHVLNVCGAAAVLGPLLGVPVGGGIFASEVLYKSSLDYNDLFPAILSSSFGYFIYDLSYQIPNLNYDIHFPHLSSLDILLIIIAAVIAGFVGQEIIFIYNTLEQWVSNLSMPDIFKPIAAGGLAALLINLFKMNEVITKLKVEEILFSSLAAKILISLLIFKVLITIIVISSGGSVAMVDTALLIGGLLGDLLHFLIPLQLELLVITCMSAILASLANVPLATIILIPEIFGINLSLPIALGSIIGFLIGRAQTVYQYLELE